MRRHIDTVVGGLRGRAGGLAAAVVAGAFLAACASAGDGTSLRERLFGERIDTTGGVATVQQDYPEDFFLTSSYCPPVHIQNGGEAMVAYERGHDGERDFITYQGSIARTARECHAVDAETLVIKLGIAGRVVAGPKGSAGAVTLPVRVAVIKQHGGDVFYDGVFNVPVTLAAPEFGADFSQVFEQVVFKVAPDDRDLIVYVGFKQDTPTG